MKGDNRIAEMIREMEQTFAERDALYKDRDEALARKFQSLKEREEELKKTDSDRKESETALKALEEELKKKEEDLSSREERLREERESFDKDRKDWEGQFREEQIHLNLLQAKLQNEKVRQQTQWLYREGTVRDKADTNEGEAAFTEKEPVFEEMKKLRAENAQLKTVMEVLKSGQKEDSRIMEDLRREKEDLEKECASLQREKQDLFKKLLAADEMVSGKEDDPDDEEDIEYLPPAGEEEEDEEARFDDFLSYFRVQYPDEKLETFRMEDGRRGIRLETENYNAEILPGDRSTLVIGIPMTETRKLKKQIRQINADGGMQCRYDRDRKETVFTLPFQEEDAPEDVSNLLRCVLDYEVPALREKGGDR